MEPLLPEPLDQFDHWEFHTLVTSTIGHFEKTSFITGIIGHFDQNSDIIRASGQNDQIRIPTKIMPKKCRLAR